MDPLLASDVKSVSVSQAAREIEADANLQDDERALGFIDAMLDLNDEKNGWYDSSRVGKGTSVGSAALEIVMVYTFITTMRDALTTFRQANPHASVEETLEAMKNAMSVFIERISKKNYDGYKIEGFTKYMRYTFTPWANSKHVGRFFNTLIIDEKKNEELGRIKTVMQRLSVFLHTILYPGSKIQLITPVYAVAYVMYFYPTLVRAFGEEHDAFACELALHAFNKMNQTISGMEQIKPDDREVMVRVISRSITMLESFKASNDYLRIKNAGNLKRKHDAAPAVQIAPPDAAPAVQIAPPDAAPAGETAHHAIAQVVETLHNEPDANVVVKSDEETTHGEHASAVWDEIKKTPVPPAAKRSKTQSTPAKINVLYEKRVTRSSAKHNM